MTNLTCFWHPEPGYFDYENETPCETCGRPMGYPLDHLPSWDGARQFEIHDGIDRGYYSATYVAEDTGLGNMVCLKVVPKSIYEMHGKSFDEECREHNKIARDSRHLVSILDKFDVDVVFGGTGEPLPCHVAVLDYVDGTSLKGLLDSTEPVSAVRTAQIAIDLMRLLGELERGGMFHNDLHAGNILLQDLPDYDARQGAADPYIRAVAVDLGSMRDGSRSVKGSRMADSHEVVRHLLELAGRLTPDPATATDEDYRLSVVLRDIANILRPENVNQRQPNWADMEAQILNGLLVATSPWKQPAEGLGRFADAFNAQTMRSWFIPRLLVDPGGQWQGRLESPGPQVVTGMRGCGKTMLLRSLQFHSRASSVISEGTSTQEAARLLGSDSYVGLYVSCNRLLDGLGTPDDLHLPFARLFLAYAREALQALRHLEELTGHASLSPVSPRPIVEVVRSLIAGSDLRGDESPVAVERRIHQMLLSLENREPVHDLNAHPTVAMPRLAEAVAACSPIWADKRVLFLLDDVSTRQLNEKNIRDLVSTLMFANESCAFKLTTEAQTLELVLKSPGLVERAQVGRDYESFDLASQIHDKLRERNGRAGREFVSEVLNKRARHLTSHPRATPLEVLGDRPLIDTARQIVDSSGTSAERKSVYHGMSALASICVGDIGDVISIYELILGKKGAVQSYPVNARLQTSAFQEFCARRLYHLNRRGGSLKEMADGFAAAAHDLLMDSARARLGTSSSEVRLRDYSSVYVRVTAGDVDSQLERLRELMDAGVFVLTGGPDSPRTKTKDGDPSAQFILTYRKLLGLTRFIGLSQRDRFELSGEDLATWLREPSQCAEILMRNQRQHAPEEVEDSASTAGPEDAPTPRNGWYGPTETSDHGLAAHETAGAVGAAPSRGRDDRDGRDRRTRTPGVGAQEALFLSPRDAEQEAASATLTPPLSGGPDRAVQIPSVTILNEQQVEALRVSAVVAGLGFEERAQASIRRVAGLTGPARALLVGYEVRNEWSEKCREAAAASDWNVELVDAPGFGRAITGLQESRDNQVTVVDVTGLSKPLIFTAVRALLLRDGAVVVAHTSAEVYYPLHEDVARSLAAAQDDDYARLEACTRILTGEEHDYSFRRLLPDDVDQGRRKVVLASSSAKHERLYRLLDERESDHVEILVPPQGAPRAQLARLAGSVAARDAHSCHLAEVATGDVLGALQTVSECYERYCLRENYSFEVGLTGSKSHAVALAAASARLRFHQAWYVEPRSFDTDRFTEGAGRTTYTRIAIEG